MVFLGDFFERFFAESAIHCFPYVVRREFHAIEKLFWLSILIYSSICAYFAFSGQLVRYNENPTVLSIEILSQGIFEQPTFTMCYNLTDLSDTKKIIQKHWKIEPSSPEFEKYHNFVATLTRTNYGNMRSLAAFNVSEFQNVDFLMIARDMRKSTSVENFRHVITELGMCQSSTKFHEYQNPWFEVDGRNHSVIKYVKCSSLEVCRTSVSPSNIESKDSVTIFMDNNDEVMTADGSDFVILEGTKIVDRVIKIEQIIAEPDLIEVNPKGRKCLFTNEPQSKHFQTYTRNLCKIDCRIKQAQALCKCVPFFYPVKNVKVCDIDGMLCLSANMQWYNVSKCDCPSLCETVIMTRISSKNQDLQFDKMLTVDLVFPKTRILRSVMFSFEDLMVGFGGSVALFLGFSFLTGIELTYFVIEYWLNLVIKSCIMSKPHISTPQKKHLLSTRTPY